MDVLETVVLRPLSDAFIEVGVWVALLLAVFGLVQWRYGDAVSRFLVAHPKAGPLLGAIIGATPGCGGAIIATPLYLRGTVSFGTVVAALVATMGDSSFVLIAASPRAALHVHLILIATGAVSGLTVDALGLRPRAVLPPTRALASTVGAAAAETGITGRSLSYRFPGPAFLGFWGLVLVGLVIAVDTLGTSGLSSPTAPDVPFAIGVVGGLTCLGTHLASRRRAGGPIQCTTARGALRDAARETAFVTVWVSVAFVAFAAVGEVAPLAFERLPAAGLGGVLAGAVVGLVPGCGPQIVLTGLHVQGALPLSVLVANALSQDGDALLPLLAADRRAALFASVLTVIPGLIVGGGLVLLGG